MSRTKQMKHIELMLSEKREQLARLQIEIQTLETLQRRAKGEADIPPARSIRPRKSNVKQIVLDLLEERGPAGLNAALAVDMAKGRGEHLERGTVSSLLSRLKSDGLVDYDNTLYRIKNSSNPRSEGEVLNVH